MASVPSGLEKGKEKERENGKPVEEVTNQKVKKEGLGWIEWLMGWLTLAYEMLFQRIVASNLENPLPLPPINDLTFIVTGSTSGIGKEVARQLAEAGGHVVMAVRNTKAATDIIKKWQEDWSGRGLPLNIEVMELDLLSLDSVVRFAEAWNARSGPLHALINNAGIFSIGEPQKFSKDGHEEHMQVNHLAPALLSILLLPSLIRSSPSRIVNVNSLMHFLGFVDPEDMNVTSGKRKFTSMMGYSNSKLAQIMFSSVLNKRLPTEAGINVACVSPGIVQTNVARDLPSVIQAAYRLIPFFIFNPEEGSRSTLFAATDPQLVDYCESLKAEDWPVCAFLSHDCRPANPSEEAHNVETAYRVWEKTLELIGLPSDAVERLIEGGEVKCKYGDSQ
ncbi:Dehydrogenases with different specificities (related to short-chain alcohol dehydrogenases) [Handroanthus impetiginosus]|uniref:Dehydrogenases with different specificities (Related to short-chain alcohol dehydrogenases) n=1 Tax=Handroanthus impetiginosus TaxID=429701 RepID=A0A2G9GZL4_9LAMI|nr:Dehydrogenases with different specificities (related to short-chain alcohol dehydrogenases) [Handroanthus impetiginosus]